MSYYPPPGSGAPRGNPPGSAAGPASGPKPVMFFSTGGGGAPVPAQSVPAGPGGMAPPSSGAPMGMPPPPSGGGMGMGMPPPPMGGPPMGQQQQGQQYQQQQQGVAGGGMGGFGSNSGGNLQTLGGAPNSGSGFGVHGMQQGMQQQGQQFGGAPPGQPGMTPSGGMGGPPQGGMGGVPSLQHPGNMMQPQQHPSQQPFGGQQQQGLTTPQTMQGMSRGDSSQGLGGPNVQTDAQGVMSGGANSNAAPLPQIADMDLSIQCNPCFLRPSVGKIVCSQSQAVSSKIPLGMMCKPMHGDKGEGTNDEIEVVDFGATGIVRCKRCRTYINPFVTWADNGRRWRCNICGMLNDVPSTYFSHLDSNGQRRDKDQRPELSRCSVEFVAPGDYMVRPPQPPVYFFVIDVGEITKDMGLLQNMVNAIKASLDDLPGAPRTQIGFLTYDSTIHFYNLKSTLSAPQMLVVPDIADSIIPSPEDLLVNLQESRTVVETLLDSLPSMFRSTAGPNGNGGPGGVSQPPSPSCAGPALMAAKRVIQHLGGKLMLFQSTLPSMGEGSLKMRENPRLMGTDKEHTLLNPEDPWYKTNAVDFSRLQVAVDTFLFSGQYSDLATVSTLAKYTGGSAYYYPGFLSGRDGAKFEHDLQHNLTRATAFEAVMRVRATRGMRFSNFYGNHFVRGTDLLALPVCHSDSCFALDMAYDEPMLNAQVVTVQAALLYTTSMGERRIRVHTMVLPVTNSTLEMTESLDIDCAMNLLSKQAVDIACKMGLEAARQRVHQTTVEIMRYAKNGGSGGQQQPQHMGGPPGQQQGSGGGHIPATLLLLPLYSMSLQKSLVIRGGVDVRTDERAFYHHLLQNMDIEESKVFIYPRMFSIHDMADDAGVPSDNVDDDCPTAGPFQVRLPQIMNLSYERLASDGIFLMENGYDMFMWIGRSVNPAILSTLLGYQSLDGVNMSELAVQPENSDYSSRVHSVLVALRSERVRYMQLHFIREGDGYAEAYLARYLIEDRANFQGGNLSYTEYHSHVTRALGGP